MKKMYLEPSLTYIRLITDVITTSDDSLFDFGDGDWGVNDDFE